jgi:hypothetical protein
MKRLANFVLWGIAYLTLLVVGCEQRSRVLVTSSPSLQISATSTFGTNHVWGEYREYTHFPCTVIWARFDSSVILSAGRFSGSKAYLSDPKGTRVDAYQIPERLPDPHSRIYVTGWALPGRIAGGSSVHVDLTDGTKIDFRIP